jgi:hypothetical protein
MPEPAPTRACNRASSAASMAASTTVDPPRNTDAEAPTMVRYTTSERKLKTIFDLGGGKSKIFVLAALKR